MFDMPDWFKQYQSKDAWGNPAGASMSPSAALSPGLNTAAPVVPSQMPGGSYNDVDNVPYNPMTGPNNSSQAMRGAPVPPSIPPAMQASFPPQPANVPLPPVHNGGNWATTAALEGDPAGQPVWASAADLRDQLSSGRALPDWATPNAQKAAAAENRQIGPGSWLDPSKLGGMIGKNSLVGKMLALRNTSDAPTGPAPNHTGLLSGLFNDGAPLGRSLTEPNSTIGGLW